MTTFTGKTAQLTIKPAIFEHGDDAVLKYSNFRLVFGETETNLSQLSWGGNTESFVTVSDTEQEYTNEIELLRGDELVIDFPRELDFTLTCDIA